MIVTPFGKITDIIQGQEEVEGNISTWFSLKQYLQQKYPALENEMYIVAKNREMYSGETDFIIDEKDEIALMPPFSGG
jgi:molybdopterin converting factor small subunit